MNEEDFELDPSEEDRISLEASAWIAKRDEGFSPEDQDAFFEWLALDPKHKSVYMQRLNFWEEMSGLAHWRPEHSREPNPDLLAYRAPASGKSRLIAYSGIAAALVLGILVFLSLIDQNKVESRMLAFGGAESYENHILDDGSVVELNKGAEVSVQYSRKERLVFLHAGEAHFMVAKDLSRPFQVRAGDAVVEATGTAFNVALNEDGVEVLVTEGTVILDAPTLIASYGESDFIKHPPRELVAGQRSRIASASVASVPLVALISNEEIDQQLAWKSEDLDFTNVPLSKVVEELNRRNRTKIVVDHSELLGLSITAKLRSNNLDGFLELLHVTMNIESNRENEFRIVLRKRSI